MCSIKITNINNDSFMDYVEEIERRALEANMTSGSGPTQTADLR